MTVTDPSGAEWSVSRDWFELPRWSRRRRGDVDLGNAPDIGWLGGDDSLAGLLAVVALVALFIVALVFLVPLVFLVLGVLVALLGVAARFLSLATWEITARGRDTSLVWRVRGPVRSRRAMHDVAAAITRGDVPLVGGHPGRTG